MGGISSQCVRVFAYVLVHGASMCGSHVSAHALCDHLAQVCFDRGATYIACDTIAGKPTSGVVLLGRTATGIDRLRGTAMEEAPAVQNRLPPEHVQSSLCSRTGAPCRRGLRQAMLRKRHSRGSVGQGVDCDARWCIDPTWVMDFGSSRIAQMRHERFQARCRCDGICGRCADAGVVWQ